MEPETIIASEVTQVQKEKDGMFSHTWSPASNLFFSVFYMKHKWKSVEPKGVNNFVKRKCMREGRTVDYVQN